MGRMLMSVTLGGARKAERVGDHFRDVLRLHQQVRLVGAARTRMPSAFTSSRKLSAMERNACCVAENCPVVRRNEAQRKN